MRWPMRVALLIVGTSVVLALYVLFIDEQAPDSQSAEIAAVIDGVDPPNGRGLRADVTSTRR